MSKLRIFTLPVSILCDSNGPRAIQADGMTRRGDMGGKGILVE